VERVKKAGAVLDAGLASKDADEHGEALVALGASGRSDALGKLTEALKAEKGELRFSAARGLRYLRDRSAGHAIAVAFRAETGWRVREELASAAGACQTSELVPELKVALKDPNARVSLAAMFALHELGDPAGAALDKVEGAEREGVPKAGTDKWSRKVLSGQKDGDKALAAKTLTLIGTGEDVALLEPQLSAAQSTLRIWAAAGVLKLGVKH
jgi:HEAT repeat protein